ncbi:MAG: putative colanic acid biosynthesis acetyltransferase [Lentisphaerae bacterium]|nr:putative colanic acid biosynthesis acetyltransferase [Lentisphaerota bacterium]
MTYLRRAAWRLVWLTLWQVAHWRLTGLRSALLRCFGARVGRGTALRASSWIEMPWQLTLGDRCLIGDKVRLYNLGPITIGDDSVISQWAHLCAGTHDYADPAFPLVRMPIQIGRQVWVAADAFVGPGVTLGEGVVVGARAVVVKDVAAWTIVGGNPARPIKRRTLGELSLKP